jgi:pentatricopeptide repeat protein
MTDSRGSNGDLDEAIGLWAEVSEQNISISTPDGPAGTFTA